MSMEEENIQVVVRIRPITVTEKKEGDIACVKAVANGKEVQVKVGPLDAQVYRCNHCFGNDTPQAAFFNESGITQLLDSTMEGYRSCAFAFGQTGAGKTFTMLGPVAGGRHTFHKEKQGGMIPRSLDYLFSRLSALQVAFKIKLSCLEIYHEQVYDLFAEEKERVSLSIRESTSEGFYLEGAKLVNCDDYEIACAALDVAMRNRQVGSHDLNSRSSRSHCLTEIFVEVPVMVNEEGLVEGSSEEPGPSKAAGRKLPKGQYLSRGKISLVDLAGSERLKSTKSTGKVLQEAGFINKSLYVLGKVIAGLVRTNGDLNHKDVPYRDSKLTKLLISSLGGSGRTLLVSCVSEAKGSQHETLRTLKFSMSCARIRNKPVKFLDPQQKLILELRDQIKRLRNENKKLRSTILTAPAGSLQSSPLSHDKSGAGGLHHGSNNQGINRAFSDDDGIASVRSKSAYSVSKNQHRGSGGRNSSMHRMSPLKTGTANKGRGKGKGERKMRSSQSDFTGAAAAGTKGRNSWNSGDRNRSSAFGSYDEAEENDYSDGDDDFERHHSSSNVARGFSPKTSHTGGNSLDEHETDTVPGTGTIGANAAREKRNLVPLSEDAHTRNAAASNDNNDDEEDDDGYGEEAFEHEDDDEIGHSRNHATGKTGADDGDDDDDDMSALSAMSHEAPMRSKQSKIANKTNKKKKKTKERGEDYADGHSVASGESGYSGASKRSNRGGSITQDELDDNVRRYATGPMIFRNGNVDIVPIRESKYIEIRPANNMMKSREAQRILDLERRVAKMEKEERKRAQEAKLGQGHSSAAEESDASSMQQKTTVKKKKPRGVKQELSMQWKNNKKHRNSPYIAHLQQDQAAGPTVGASSPSKQNQARVVPGRPKPSFSHPHGSGKQGIAAERSPHKKAGIPRGLPVKKRDPHAAAHNDDNDAHSEHSAAPKKRPGLPPGLPVKRMPRKKAGPAVDGDGDDCSVDSRKSAQSARQSIADELAELGLEVDPIPAPAGNAGNNKAGRKVVKRTGPTAANNAGAKKNRPGLPVIPNNGRGGPAARGKAAAASGIGARGKPRTTQQHQQQQQQQHSSKKASEEKLPEITPSSAPSSAGTASSARETAARRGTAGSTASEPDSRSSARVSGGENGGAAMDPQERFLSLQDKLEELEHSLAKEREQMEDHPGHVTQETEQKYAAMLEEAKNMRQELIASGIILTATTDEKSRKITAAEKAANALDLGVELEESTDSAVPVPASVQKMMEELDTINATATPDAVMKANRNSQKANPPSVVAAAAAPMAEPVESILTAEPSAANQPQDSPVRAAEDEYGDDDYESDGFEDDIDAVLEQPSVKTQPTAVTKSHSQDAAVAVADNSTNEAPTTTDTAPTTASTAAAAPTATATAPAPTAEQSTAAQKKEKEWMDLALAAGSDDDNSSDDDTNNQHLQAPTTVIGALDTTATSATGNTAVNSSNAGTSDTAQTSASGENKQEEVQKQDREGEEEEEYSEDDYEDEFDSDEDEDDGAAHTGRPRSRPKSRPKSNSGAASSTVPKESVTETVEGGNVTENNVPATNVETSSPAGSAETASGINVTADSSSGSSSGPSSGKSVHKKYSYYSGPQTEDTPPLEMPVAGYSSRLNIASDQVRYDSRGNSPTPSQHPSRSTSPVPSSRNLVNSSNNLINSKEDTNNNASSGSYVPTNSYEPTISNSASGSGRISSSVKSSEKVGGLSSYNGRSESNQSNNSINHDSSSATAAASSKAGSSDSSSSSSIAGKSDDEAQKDSPTSITTMDDAPAATTADATTTSASSQASSAKNISPSKTPSTTLAVTAAGTAAALVVSADDEYEDEFDDMSVGDEDD